MKETQTILQILKNHGIQVREEVSLKNYTTLHIGGNAKLLSEPSNIEEVQTCIEICKSYQLPYFILGNGSNVLVLDEGYDGLVIVLSTHFHHMIVNNNKVRVESGASLKALSAFCMRHSLTGMEFACGIPGSVGGAVYMNAGAYGGEMKDLVQSVIWLDQNGRIQKSNKEDLALAYRHSVFMDNKGIVLEVEIQMQEGNKEEILLLMEELMRKRRSRQPLDSYSAGSTFKRPQGNYASALIQDAGLKGVMVNDAQVSEKHAGFLINRNNATSRDFLDLIQLVQHRVKEHSGYELECEVQIMK